MTYGGPSIRRIISTCVACSLRAQYLLVPGLKCRKYARVRVRQVLVQTGGGRADWRWVYLVMESGCMY